MNRDAIPWLLESDPWTRYRTCTDLLDMPAGAPEVQKAHEALLEHPKVRSLFDDASQWFPESITRHNVPTLSHYSMTTLAEFGLTVQDPGMKKLAEKACQRTENDSFAVRQTLP